MKTTTVFKSGNSLAVRLPKGFVLPLGRVFIEQRKGEVVLRSAEQDWPENRRTLFSPSPLTADWTLPAQGQNQERDLTW